MSPVARIKDRLQAWKDTPVTRFVMSRDKAQLRQMAELGLS